MQKEKITVNKDSGLGLVIPDPYQGKPMTKVLEVAAVAGMSERSSYGAW